MINSKDHGEEENYENNMKPMNYEYTCVFEFNGKTDLSPYIHLIAKGICPKVKMGHNLINFKECEVHNRKDFVTTIENRNDNQPVEFSFSKVAHYKVTPSRSVLMPHSP